MLLQEKVQAVPYAVRWHFSWVRVLVGLVTSHMCYLHHLRLEPASLCSRSSFQWGIDRPISDSLDQSELANTTAAINREHFIEQQRMHLEIISLPDNWVV